MKIINRRSLSTKLKRCRDFIRSKLKTISCTRLQYGSEEEDDDHNKHRKLKAISGTRLQYASEEDDDDNLKTICPRKEYFRFEDDHSKDLKLKAICTLKQYKSEDDHEDRWSKHLPDDVMQLILQRLPVSDYLSCLDVCPCWRAAIDSKRCLPAHDELPWVLFDTCASLYIKDDCFISYRKICKPAGPYHRYYAWDCVGTIDGWLIMEGRLLTSIWKFFFLNPVSGAQVMLASHPAPKRFKRVKLVASSVPTKLRLQQRSCYVTCLHLNEEGRFAFCMPSDKSWTFIEAEGHHEKALKFYDTDIVDGKLYAIGSHALEFLMVFNIQLDTNDDRRKVGYSSPKR